MGNSNSKVSLVYARALLSAAKERSVVEKLCEDIRKASIILEQENKALYYVLSSPIVELEGKKGIVSSVFLNIVDTVLLNFMLLLLDKDRFNYINDIFETYGNMVDEDKGVARGKIKVSKMPDTENRTKILRSIEGMINKKIEAEFVEDKDLVAGFSANIGSYGLEYSFDSHLREIEKKLIRG